ncbi:mucin-associated surface protein [Trypanosoma cruzi cruzi]|uniref:Mucin-associated surface protein (MASP) n=1 Tax=Trypanosoma cruzi TaxID=5693 RepID=A0A2V2VF73_TRYCR|nr:mucin-associated surface protein [Trypanosoma cruzi cruzi]PWU93828.1 Mucin-associated surface protein (MASP) [Trypanosoma cruzi]
MAMMMTGRVLLVCALCVLWCGAVFGHATEDYCSEGEGNGLRHTSNGGDDGVSLKAYCGLLSTRMALIKAVDAAETGQELSVVPDPPQDKSKVSLPNNKQSTGAPGSKGDSVAGEPEAAPLGSGGSGTGGQVRKLEVVDKSGEEVADTMDHKDGTATGPQHQRADQLSSSSSGSSGTEGVKRPSLRANSESNEALDDPPQEEKDLRGESDSREGEAEELEKKEEDNGNRNDKALTDISENPAKHTEVQTTTTELNGQSSAEALEDVKQPEEVQSEKDSNNNPQTKSVATIAANQHNEPPADHGESGPPSPTENGDAANNEADKSTEEGMPNSDPAADAAETRDEKQNENKDANPKETPVTATAMKTTTATTGDSDGSTAASHATSPLSLLVVVACAAAAAVVAA